MKKGKFLVVASLIACCSILASCDSATSSAEPSSSTTSSEPDSSNSSSSDYSSEDSSSDDISSEDSSSDDSSSISSEEPASQATITLSLADNLYAFVYTADLTASEHPADTDERILGSNGESYENYTATVEIGSSIFIENLNNYSIDYTLSTGETGTIAEYNGGISSMIEISADCSISLTASEVAEPTEYATINYVSENSQVYALILDASLETAICGSNGTTTTESGQIAVGEYIYIQNLNVAADYVVTSGSETIASGSIAAYGEMSNSIQVNGDITITLSATAAEEPTEYATINYVSTDENIYGIILDASDTTLTTRICGSNGDSYNEASGSIAVGSFVYIQNLNAAADYVVTSGEDVIASGSIGAYGVLSDSFEVTGDCTVTLSASSVEPDEYATITYVSEDPDTVFGYVLDASDASLQTIVCGSNGSTYSEASGSIAVGSFVYIRNLNVAADYTVVFADESEETITGSIDAYGELSNSFEITGDCTITLSATPAEDPTEYATITYVSEDETVYGYIVDTDLNPICGSNGSSYSEATGTVAVGSFVYIENLAARADYVVTMGEDTIASGSIGAYGLLSDSFEVTGDITVTLTRDYTHTISFENEENVTFTSSSSYSETPEAGDTIYIVYSAAEGKYVSSAATITGSSSGDLSSASGYTNSYYASSTSFTIRFTMPDEDIKISFNTGNNLAVAATEDTTTLSTQISVRTSYYNASSEVTSVTPGRSYYICAYPADGYILSGFNINGTEVTSGLYSYSGIYYLSYTVPSDATAFEVSAIVSVAYTATNGIDSTYASTVRFNTSSNSGTFAAGASVTFYVTPSSYYTIDENTVQVLDADNASVAISDLAVNSNNGIISGTFTMPESNVTLSLSETPVAKDLISSSDIAISYDDTAASLATSYTIRGNTSGASTSSSDTVVSFIDGETIQIRFDFSSTAYDYAIYAITADGEELIDAYTSTSYIYGSYTVSSSLQGFKLTATEKQPLGVTYNIDEGVSISYAYSESSTSMLSGMTSADNFDGIIYSGYYCYFQISSEQSGYVLDYSVTNSAGEEITVRSKSMYEAGYSSSETWYYFQPTEDFTINVTLEAAATVRYVCDLSNVYIDCEDPEDYNTVYCGTTNGTDVISEGYAKIGASAVLYCGYGSYGTTYYYTVDFDSEEYTDVTGTITSYGTSDEFIIHGDCTITITDTDPALAE